MNDNLRDMSNLSAEELRQIIIDNTVFLEDVVGEVMFVETHHDLKVVSQKVHKSIYDLYLALEESSARGVEIPELEK